MPGLVAAAAASGAILFYLVGEPLFAGLFFSGFVAMLVVAFVVDRRSVRAPVVETRAVPDFTLLGASLDLTAEPAPGIAAALGLR